MTASGLNHDDVSATIDRELPNIEGWCSPEKAKRMAELSRGAELCVELGVYGGRGLVAMALGLSAGGLVVGIDPYAIDASLEGTNQPVDRDWWSKVDYEAIYRGAIDTIRRLDLPATLIRAKSREVVCLYKDESIDVLHQDSNHSEEISCEEVELWVPKLKLDGYWIFDDTDWPGTQKAQKLLEKKGFKVIEDHDKWKIYQRADAKKKDRSEEEAWKHYLAAKDLEATGHHQLAIHECAMGLTKHPGIAELHWLAAVASYRLGKHDHAVYWANLAVKMGRFTGIDVPRSTLEEPALYELPYDVLRYAAATEEERKKWEEYFWFAKDARFGAPVQEAAVSRKVTSESRSEARRDLVAIAKPLAGATIVPIPKLAPSYNNCNPSIAIHNSKLAAVVRTVNYSIQPGGWYHIPEADQGVVKTINYLAEIDPDTLSIQIEKTRMIDDATNRRFHPSRIQGFEDMRLFEHRGALYATATVRDHAPGERCDVALLELDGTSVKRMRVLSDMNSDRAEKNWMPVVRDDAMSVVYSVDPDIVHLHGQLQRVDHPDSNLALDHLRGGSQVIEAPEGGYFCVTHEVVHADRRIYLHRFVWFNDDIEAVAVSPAFYFKSLGIEFCAGAVIYNDQLIMSVGFDDREAAFVRIPYETILKLEVSG